MRRAALLAPALLVLAACSSTDGEAVRADRPSPSALETSSAPADASPTIGQFDIAAVCSQYCDFLDGVSDNPCSPDPYSYHLCAPLVDEVEGVLDIVTTHTPPDVAYSDLQDASEQLQTSIDEYRKAGCTSKQQGDADEVCSVALTTVRFNTDTVVARLRSAP